MRVYNIITHGACIMVVIMCVTYVYTSIHVHVHRTSYMNMYILRINITLLSCDMYIHVYTVYTVFAGV